MRQLAVKLVFLIILLPANSLAGILETGYRADFNLYASGFLVASTTRHLFRVQDGMEYRTYTKPEGIAKWYTSDTLVEISKFRLDKNIVTAQSYQYHQTGNEEEKIVDITFDQSRQKVRLSNETGVHVLHAESYDALSFQIALMQKLANGEKNLVADIADQNGLYTYDARVVGSEIIKTEVGKLNTLKIFMENRQNGNLFTFWCAPRFDYLPVRIELERVDSGIDSMLEIKTFHEPLKSPQTASGSH